MALTKNIRVYVLIAAAALTLAACAKRDSDFKGRKNASGANYTNGDQAQRADDNARAMGYDTDILVVQAPQSLNGVLTVDSYIKVNNNNYKITTTHTQVGADSQGTATFDGANFAITGRCATQNCNPYYLAITITRGGQQIKQTAMKKFFYYTTQDSSNDLIMSLGAGEFMNMQQLVQALDSATFTGGTGGDTSLYTKAQ